jgi:lysophospholipase L1-like esterase
MQEPSRELAAAHRLAVILGTLALMLAIVLGWQLTRERPGTSPGEGEDSVVTDDGGDAVAKMVSANGGLYDSHPDADVSRVLLPGLVDRPYGSDLVSSNAFGLREHDFELPKPADTLRVVLLGDSYIHGLGVAADERLGVHLERRLTALAPAGLAVEVLHVGITSWNLLSQEAFLRRKLSLIQPDLVIHQSVSNDLDDTSGVRGFGSPGRLVPRRPEQGDVIVRLGFPRFELHQDAHSLLAWGEDGESRARYAEAAAAITRLAQAVADTGGAYTHVMNWNQFTRPAAQQLLTELPTRQVSWLGMGFSRDPQYRLSKSDEHWNLAGHERMGAYLCGLILERGLLPMLDVGDDDEARDIFTRMNARGAFESEDAGAVQKQLAQVTVSSVIEPGRWTGDTASQVHGGLDREGQASPFVSFVLAVGGGSLLRLEGVALPRPELDGATLEVHVDGAPVGGTVLRAGEDLLFRAALPAAARDRRWVAVRLSCDDFAHAGDDLRKLVSYRLTRAAIE